MSQQTHLPIFRTDLEIIDSSDTHGHRIFVLRDIVSEKAFELKEEDYFICKQLDGKTSLAGIRSAFRERFNAEVSIVKLESFISHIGRLELLRKDAGQPPSAAAIPNFFSPEDWKRWDLFDPQRPLAWLSWKLRWCYTQSFGAASATIMVLGLGVLLFNFPAFWANLGATFATLSIPHILDVFYLCFNIPSQVAKVVTASYYGSGSGKFGILLMFDFFPVFYYDKDMREVVSKTNRSWILFSPIYCILLITSLGLIWWKTAPSGMILQRFGFVLAVMGMITTLVRCNVFWPTEGAHLLSNWLDIPDLRNRSIQFMRAWILRRTLPESLTSRDSRLFKWYGLLAEAITVVSIVAGVYYFATWITDSYNGAGALAILALVVTKYHTLLLGFFSRICKRKNIQIEAK